MARALAGAAIAAGAALIALDVPILGIAAWKVVLAVAGAVVFVLSGPSKGSRGDRGASR